MIHPNAVLRTTIGLTQQQLGELVNRAARTIQSIELRKLPLTEDLALRIAEATGVDEAWLFAGDPNTPPQKGLTLIQAGKGEGEYVRADYEFYRAYLETPIWTEEKWAETIKKAEAQGNKSEVMQLATRKLDVFERQKEIISILDDALTVELKRILLKTRLTDDVRLVRWKVRRFLEDLAREFSVEIPHPDLTIKALAIMNPSAPTAPESPKPIGRTGAKAKR